MAERKTKKQEDQALAGDTETKTGSQAEAKDTAKTKPTGVSGPGTGAASPADEQDRMPSTTVLPSEAGPLVPTDVQKVHEPADGHPESSTNSVAANAAQRSVPGSNHIRLLDEDGNDVDIEDVFEGPDGPSMFVTTRMRLYQEFTYPKASTKTTQLLYPRGARVTLAEAERFKASVKALLAS